MKGTPRKALNDEAGEDQPLFALGGIWCFMMAGLGLYFPFYSFYLSENVGLSGSQIGMVVATMPLVGMLAQPFWGGLGDRTGARARVLALVALGTGVGYALLTLPNGFYGYLITTAFLACFAPALTPMGVSTSLGYLTAPPEKAFGRVRVMGTLGYAFSVGMLPILLERLPDFDEQTSPVSNPDLIWIFPLAGFSVLIAALLALTLPKHSNAQKPTPPSEWLRLMQNAAFIRVLVFSLVAYFLLQGPTVLFPILVRAHGGGLEAISEMWLIMLILEVPLIFWVGATMKKIGPRSVIAIGLAAASLRWGISGFVDDLQWVYAAQILHGVTVWGVIVGVPLYADRIMPHALRSTGQGILGMIGVGLGSILSNLTTGWLSEHVSPKAPAQYASLACLGLLVILPVLLRKSDTTINR